MIGTIAEPSLAGPYSGTFTWTAWNAGSGRVENKGASNSFLVSWFPYVNTNQTPTSPPVTTSTTTQVITPLPSVVTATPPTSVSTASAINDAYINMTGSHFISENNLTTGGAQAWYQSPVVSRVYGGAPDAQQQSAFTSTVLADVQRAFDQSGLTVHLTTDPHAAAAHELSVVSGASYAGNPDTIGITNVGGSGFSFIDKLTNFNTPESLAQAVANNVAHELMHAFGVAVHHDPTGNYIDSAVASTALLEDPNATFSPAAVQDLLAHDFKNAPLIGNLGSQVSGGTAGIEGEQTIVPEPSTILLWTSVLGAGIIAKKRTQRWRSALV
jgi:hypothetical protein